MKSLSSCMWAGQRGLSDTSLTSHRNLRTCESPQQGVFIYGYNRDLLFAWEAVHKPWSVSCHHTLFSLCFELSMKDVATARQVSLVHSQEAGRFCPALTCGTPRGKKLIRGLKSKRGFMGDFLILSSFCKVTGFWVTHIYVAVAWKNILILQNVTRVGQPGGKPSRRQVRSDGV